MLLKTKSGQSIIEVVFAIGLIALVLTGVVGLLLSSLRSRTQGYDRKRAAELGQKVIEGLVEEESQNPSSFWNPNSGFWLANTGSTHTMTGFDRYTYGVAVTAVAGPGGTCVVAAWECVEARVTINWTGSTPGEKLDFSRFFSKK